VITGDAESVRRRSPDCQRECHSRTSAWPLESHGDVSRSLARRAAPKLRRRHSNFTAGV